MICARRGLGKGADTHAGAAVRPGHSGEGRKTHRCSYPERTFNSEARTWVTSMDPLPFSTWNPQQVCPLEARLTRTTYTSQDCHSAALGTGDHPQQQLEAEWRNSTCHRQEARALLRPCRVQQSQEAWLPAILPPNAQFLPINYLNFVFTYPVRSASLRLQPA